jgi:hypothetical protein
MTFAIIRDRRGSRRFGDGSPSPAGARPLLLPGLLLDPHALEFFGSLGLFGRLFYRHELTGLLTALGPAVAPPSLVFTCDRLFTAPFQMLSLTGLLTATLILPLLYIW